METPEFSPIVTKYGEEYEAMDRQMMDSLMPSIESKYVARLITSLNDVLKLFGVEEPLPILNAFTYESFSMLSMVANAIEEAKKAGILDQDLELNPASLKTDKLLMDAIGTLDALKEDNNFVTWLKSPRTEAAKQPEAGEEVPAEPVETEATPEEPMSDEAYLGMLNSKRTF